MVAMPSETTGDQPTSSGNVMKATMSKPRIRLNASPGGIAPTPVATIGME